MKKLILIFIVLICLISQNCKFHTAKNDSETIIAKKEDNGIDQRVDSISVTTIDVAISPRNIMNKVFYYITVTDTGDVVVDYQNSSINGIKYTDKAEYGIGHENYKLDIDSMIVNKKTLCVYTSYKYLDVFGDTIKDSGVRKIKLVPNKTGYIEINSSSFLIDSTYAGKTIPIVKEKPYDIKEAIGDF